jgi:hypothetical protein
MCCSHVTIIYYSCVIGAQVVVLVAVSLWWKRDTSRLYLQSQQLHDVVARMAKKFPAFSGRPEFIAVFTRDRDCTPSWVSWIQSTFSHPISLRIFLISSHLQLGVSSSLFLHVFTLIFCPMRAKYPAHLILHNFVTLIMFGEDYVCSSTLVYLCSSTKVRDQLQHTCKTAGEAI